MPHQTSATSDVQRQMVELARPLAPAEGYNLTALSDVRLFRSDRPLGRAPVLFDPGIMIVLQGRKRGFLGDRVYVYDEQHYLAVSVPVPFLMETEASAEAPLLAIYVRMDIKVATDLIRTLDEYGPVEEATPKGLMSILMDDRLTYSLLSFLEVMNSPREALVLGPHLVREICFRVLTGGQGSAMRASLTLQGPIGAVAKAIRAIHESFARKLDADQLADEAGMSVNAFHAYFKAFTSCSPIQYVSMTRLHQARLIMARQSVTAAHASAQVGYESQSQFNREFKFLFGLSPAEEVARMRQAITNSDPSPLELYVCSY